MEEKDETPPLATPYPYSNLNIRVYDTIVTLKTAREGTDLSPNLGLTKLSPVGGGQPNKIAA